MAKGMMDYPGTPNSRKLLPTLALKVNGVVILTLKCHLGLLENVLLYVNMGNQKYFRFDTKIKGKK